MSPLSLLLLDRSDVGAMSALTVVDRVGMFGIIPGDWMNCDGDGVHPLGHTRVQVRRAPHLRILLQRLHDTPEGPATLAAIVVDPRATVGQFRALLDHLQRDTLCPQGDQDGPIQISR